MLDYAYDSADRLVAVTQGAATVADYLHNAMGQRVAKTVGGATTHFLYDLSGRVIGEADGATGAATAEYIWLEGMPLAFVTGGAVYYVHADHLGTPQRLTDGAKAVVWDASYAPFGGATVSGSLTFNLRFPGQYLDVETGLNYNTFRDYDPALGRYVQSDPIGLKGGWNTYAYVGGNPVVFVDPDGLRVRNPNNYPLTLRMLLALSKFNACIGCEKDIIVTGGIRYPGHPNETPGSRHMIYNGGHAADIYVPGQTHLKTASQAILCGIFGGIGWYVEGGPAPHVHVDLRQRRTRWAKDENNNDVTGLWPIPDDEAGRIPSAPLDPPLCDNNSCTGAL